MSLKACKGHGRSQHVNEDVKGGITIGYIQKVILSYIYIYIYILQYTCVCARVCRCIQKAERKEGNPARENSHFIVDNLCVEPCLRHRFWRPTQAHCHRNHPDAVVEQQSGTVATPHHHDVGCGWRQRLFW